MGDEEGVAASFLDGRPGAWWRRHIKARGAGRFFSIFYVCAYSSILRNKFGVLT